MIFVATRCSCETSQHAFNSIESFLEVEDFRSGIFLLHTVQFQKNWLVISRLRNEVPFSIDLNSFRQGISCNHLATCPTDYFMLHCIHFSFRFDLKFSDEYIELIRIISILIFSGFPFIIVAVAFGILKFELINTEL